MWWAIFSVVVIVAAIIVPKPGRTKSARAALHARLLDDAARRKQGWG